MEREGPIGPFGQIHGRLSMLPAFQEEELDARRGQSCPASRVTCVSVCNAALDLKI